MTTTTDTTEFVAPLFSDANMVEIRCPGEDCGKLVLRYLRHESCATLDLKCPRCKTQWMFEVRST